VATPKILVEVICDRKGRCCIKPRSKKWARSFARVRKEHGGGESREACIRESRLHRDAHLDARDRNALSRGYPVNVEIEADLVGKWFGYGADIVARKPMTMLQEPPRFDGSSKPKVLGRVDRYGPTQSAIFYVGQRRGNKSAQRQRCRHAPTKISVTKTDQGFVKLRSQQVGKDNTGGTRISGKGWYEGRTEPSASYEVVYIPNSKEPSYRRFRHNMNRLAEAMGKEFCQDSVIVVHNDGDKRTTCGATWFVKGPAKC
jgi:hypothetical protein